MQRPSNLELREYSPKPLIHTPAKLIATMWRDFLFGRHLGWRLFQRELLSQYRQSFLGYIWAFAPFLVTSLTFIYLASSKVLNVQTTVPYALYVLLGSLFWQTFADALSTPLKVVGANRSLLTKINFPREALLIAAMGEILWTTLLRVVVSACLLPLLGLQLSMLQLLLPMGLILMVLLGFSVALIMMPIALLYSDISRMLPIALSFLYLVSPVAYAYPTGGIALFFAKLNPVVPLIRDLRDIMLGNFHISYGVIWVTLCSSVLLVLGLYLYKISMPHIIARSGS